MSLNHSQHHWKEKLEVQDKFKFIIDFFFFFNSVENQHEIIVKGQGCELQIKKILLSLAKERMENIPEKGL